MTTNVYVDGFNLYYGALKGTPYKWLDLGALTKVLLPKDTIGRIRYFTAHVSARPHDPQQPVRQQTYLRALETVPGLSVHLGHYLVSYPRMPLRNPPAGGPRTVEVIKSEEKGSDVNLATYLLLDAFRKDCDTAVVITNDSDLQEPIEIVQQELGLRVGVINPQKARHRSRSLLNVTFFKQLQERGLARSQFAPVLKDVHGPIYKPASW
jgi:uncharacterized LabA/DUF88 family protein